MGVWRSPRRISGAILALAAAPRVWSAIFDQGILWPDEVYQSLEQAHRVAFGYGFIPWEFQRGARSWIFPAALAVVGKIGVWLGGNRGFVVGARLAMVVVSLVAIAAAMKLARDLRGARAAICAGFTLASFPAAIFFGSRCMNESASAALLIGVAVLALDKWSRRAHLVAGALGAIAVFVRVQSGVFVVALALVLVLSRRWRALGAYVAAGVAVALACGALDWITWGKPFQSIVQYIQFNMIEGKSTQWGTAEARYYVDVFFDDAGRPMGLFLLGGFALGSFRAWRVALPTALFVAAHAFVPHKEFRFLMPILPPFVVVASVGWCAIVERLRSAARQPLALVLGGVITAIFFYRVSKLSLGDLGEYRHTPKAEKSAWHIDEGVNLALWRAGRQPDICGMIVTGNHWAWTGGYSYLHHLVPVFFDVRAPNLAAANYLVAQYPSAPPKAYRLVDVYETYALFRRDGSCVPPATYHFEIQ